MLTNQQQLELAQNPNTPAPILQDLVASTEDKEVLAAIAQNPNSSPDLLVDLAGNYLEEVGQNPTLELILLENYNFVEDIYCQNFQNRRLNKPLPKWFLDLAIKQDNSSIKAFVIKNKYTPISYLESLSRDRNIQVKKCLAENVNSSSILFELAKDSELRASVAYNKNTPLSLLEKLANDEKFFVREMTAGNQNSSLEILEDLANDRYSRIRVVVAENEKTSKDILKKLVLDSDFYVRRAVSRNLNSSLSTIFVQTLAPEPQIRNNAKINFILSSQKKYKSQLNKNIFTKIWSNLKTEETKILIDLLSGKLNLSFGEALKFQSSPIENQLKNIYIKFNLKQINQNDNQNVIYLLAIVARYKPALIRIDLDIIFQLFLQLNKNNLFLKNPFYPLEGAVTDPNLRMPFRSEIEKFESFIEWGLNIVLIGSKGSGKNTLLWSVYSDFKNIDPNLVENIKNYRYPIYIDLENILSEEDFLLSLCKTIGISYTRGYRFYINLSQLDRKFLIFLNNGKKLNNNYFTKQLLCQLRSLSEGHLAPLRFIMSLEEKDELDLYNKEPRFLDRFRKIKMKPLSEDEISAFIKNRLEFNRINLSQEEIKIIVEQSQGSPQKLMNLCFDLYVKKLEKVRSR